MNNYFAAFCKNAYSWILFQIGEVYINIQLKWLEPNNELNDTSVF